MPIRTLRDFGLNGGETFDRAQARLTLFDEDSNGQRSDLWRTLLHHRKYTLSALSRQNVLTISSLQLRVGVGRGLIKP